MPKCIINGKEAEFKPGENIIEVAKRVGIYIPYYCYHPALSIVAQCRMCAVEIEKMPKLQTACSTPATEGMIIKTTTERVKKNQRAIMEFLLLNHPLDCPICDKSGECDLQDFSFQYGDSFMRSSEERRTYVDLDIGGVIKKNMNRCIHCTRCLRFAEGVAEIHEMVAVKRGNNIEISTIDDRPLETDYAGNYADICPTGSLSIKDFRFKKRVWYLKKTPTVCEGCSRGCNMEVHEERGTVYRCVPRVNLEINKYWLCDEGRFNFKYVNSENRLTEPSIKSAQKFDFCDWSTAIEKSREFFQGKKTTVLVGSDLTQEEIKLILDFIPKQISVLSFFHYGTPGVLFSKDDGPADRILKMKSKTSNLYGIEKLGLTGFEKYSPQTGAFLVFRGGRASVPDLGGIPTVGIGVFQKTIIENFKIILPGTTFVEKDGTIFNFEGVEQKFKRAILPPGQSKNLSEIFMLWAHLGAARRAA
ncbi:MAG: (2Fe-2S)-binding protein [Bdellovibrio sp.]|nr:(2Fe-2S)-binding protein [Bdellovibrio sp.]